MYWRIDFQSMEQPGEDRFICLVHVRTPEGHRRGSPHLLAKVSAMAVKGGSGTIHRSFPCFLVHSWTITNRPNCPAGRYINDFARIHQLFQTQTNLAHVRVQPGSLLLPEITPVSPTGAAVRNTRPQVRSQGGEAPLCCRPFRGTRGSVRGGVGVCAVGVLRGSLCQYVLQRAPPPRIIWYRRMQGSTCPPRCACAQVLLPAPYRQTQEA